VEVNPHGSTEKVKKLLLGVNPHGSTEKVKKLLLNGSHLEPQVVKPQRHRGDDDLE
jgi:hypothetical protein